MIRLAQVSDIHIYTAARWAPADWLTRRVSGWLNVRLMRRGWIFRDSQIVLAALMQDIYERQPDHVIFSGDATALGFEEEFALASSLLRVGQSGGISCFAIPGNHDYYTRACTTAQLFEKHFAEGLEGERVDDHVYPFARRVGSIYLIGVNSSRPNRWFWDATGFVGADQLQRLRKLLARPHIASAPRILVTHYPIARKAGLPEIRWRHLDDLQDTLAIAREGGVSLWLHGHRHTPYHLSATEAIPIPSICAGSGTQRGLWTYAEHTFNGERWRVERRKYDPDLRRFATSERFEVDLKQPDATHPVGPLP